MAKQILSDELVMSSIQTPHKRSIWCVGFDVIRERIKQIANEQKKNEQIKAAIVVVG